MSNFRAALIGIAIGLVLVAFGGAAIWHIKSPTHADPVELAALDREIAEIAARIEARDPVNRLRVNLAYAKLDQAETIAAFCQRRHSSKSRQGDCQKRQVIFLEFMQGGRIRTPWTAVLMAWPEQ